MTSLTIDSSLRLEVPSTRKDSKSLSRSPHPYSRRSLNLDKDQGDIATNSLTQDQSESSSERGTEADDEKGAILRGLPAPPLRARKGLRGSKSPLDLTPAISPLPTPPAIEDGSQYFFPRTRQKGRSRGTIEERSARDVELYQKYIRRRQGEVVRRCTEIVLLCVIGCIACQTAVYSGELDVWKTEVYGAFAEIMAVYTLYPIRSVFRAARSGLSFSVALKRGLHLPSRFDPGPLLYPVFLPFFISASLIHLDRFLVITNLIIGLSSIPSESIPFSTTQISVYIHWTLTLLPPTKSQLWAAVHNSMTPSQQGSQIVPSSTREVWSLLFPLHQTLLATLRYLTATSLDPAELHLLSAGLINILLFASSPQIRILKALMWLGGLHLFVFCRKPLNWEISIARIPAWKFARNKSPKTGILGKLERILTTLLPQHKYRLSSQHDSDDEDYEHLRLARKRVKMNFKRRTTLPNGLSSDLDPVTSNEQTDRGFVDFSSNGPTKTATTANGQLSSQSPVRQPRRSISSSKTGLSSLTFTQAQALSWLIAAYTYVATVLIVLISLRYYIGVYALYSQEPFGWALGYLFGNISQLRFWVVSNNWEKWVRLPELVTKSDVDDEFGWAEVIRQTVLGPANMRLVLMGYCLLVLALGIGTVLRLGTVVEVDTRRKVFHGIMVAMMLPTIPIDPCFIALALILILSVFLLLDLFRASQLPPISKPLTSFLAPYVDGRDYRGPVIVSHIFLLIGCAIPLWLSLAASERTGRGVWTGWETAGREVSMVSGVVCVGMGDAAASLIGRRYGRTKWFWGGGKSLEGSFAFAVAVTFGLMASYLWLRIGGWVAWDTTALPKAFLKAMIAASGASLLESVLTAANDNVVVPVGLWLLVRGLKI